MPAPEDQYMRVPVSEFESLSQRASLADWWRLRAEDAEGKLAEEQDKPDDIQRAVDYLMLP
jgi:hypothetical protein